MKFIYQPCCKEFLFAVQAYHGHSCLGMHQCVPIYHHGQLPTIRATKLMLSHMIPFLFELVPSAVAVTPTLADVEEVLTAGWAS